MKFKPEKKYVQIGFTLFFTALAIMLAYFLFFRLDKIRESLSSLNRILAPITYGLVMAYLISPLLNAIELKIIYPLFNKYNIWKKDKKRKKHVRLVSITLTMCIVVLFIYLFFSSVIPQLYASIQTLISQYSVYTENITGWIEKTMDDNPDFANLVSSVVTSYTTEADDFLNEFALPAIQNFLLPNVSDLMTALTASVAKVFKLIINLIIGIIISLYVLYGKEKFTQGFTKISYAIFETPTANKFLDSVRFTHFTFTGFLGGKILDSFIIGVICYICCLFMKMPFAILVSVVIGITNVIPVFGPYLGAVPSTLIILLEDPKKAFMFVILILILQQVDGNIIGPAILAQSTGLTSFWILFAITLFGGWLGIAGMIIGVPITAVIYTGVKSLTNGLLEKKNLPTDSNKYLNVATINEDGTFVPLVIKKKKRQPDKDSIGYKLGVKLASLGKKIGSFFVNLFAGIKDKTKKK